MKIEIKKAIKQRYRLRQTERERERGETRKRYDFAIVKGTEPPPPHTHTHKKKTKKKQKKKKKKKKKTDNHQSFTRKIPFESVQDGVSVTLLQDTRRLIRRTDILAYIFHPVMRVSNMWQVP